MNKAKAIFNHKKISDKKFKVADLVRISGLSRGTWDYIVDDDTNDWPTDGVSWGTIKAVASALGVSPYDITTDNNKGR